MVQSIYARPIWRAGDIKNMHGTCYNIYNVTVNVKHIYISTISCKDKSAQKEWHILIYTKKQTNVYCTLAAKGWTKTSSSVEP